MRTFPASIFCLAEGGEVAPGFGGQKPWLCSSSAVSVRGIDCMCLGATRIGWAFDFIVIAYFFCFICLFLLRLYSNVWTIVLWNINFVEKMVNKICLGFIFFFIFFIFDLYFQSFLIAEGLKFHFASIYLDELDYAGEDQLSSEAVMAFLVPYIDLLADSGLRWCLICRWLHFPGGVCAGWGGGGKPWTKLLVLFAFKLLGFRNIYIRAIKWNVI